MSETARGTEAHEAVVEEATEHAHPGDAKYVQIALILAALTALEVSTYFVDFGSLNVPTLIVLMVIKFAMVALWFMHLRFDSRLFRRVFVFGIGLAVTVYIAALSTFQYFE